MSTAKTSFPIIVLSILMMASGLIMALAVANLPLPATDHVSGPVQIALGGFAAMSLGFGASFYRIGLVGRADRWFAFWFAIGVVGFIVGVGTSIINHPATQALGL